MQRLRRPPGVTLAELSAWVQLLGAAAEERPLRHWVEQLESGAVSVKPVFAIDNPKTGFVIYHPEMSIKDLLEGLAQNERLRSSDVGTAYSFAEFARLFTPSKLVDIRDDAAFLVVSQWADTSPFKMRACVDDLLRLNVSRTFAEIGPKLRVCMPKKTFDKLKDKKLNHHNAQIRTEIIPQLLVLANTAKNEAYQLEPPEMRALARSWVILRMLEWFISVVFVPLDGPQDASAPPRPYSLLKRQVNPLSLTASGLREPRNEADAAKAESIHIQRWTIAQNELRFPGMFQDVHSLLLAELASHLDNVEEQIELYLRSIEIDKSILSTLSADIGQLESMKLSLTENYRKLLVAQASSSPEELTANNIVAQLQEIEGQLAGLEESKKKKEDEHKHIRQGRIKNMRYAVNAMITAPEFLNILNTYHETAINMYEELLEFDRDETQGVTLKERTEDLQIAACLFQIVHKQRPNNQQCLIRASQCIQEIMALKRSRFIDAPEEFMWELQTLALLYKDLEDWDRAEHYYLQIVNQVFPKNPYIPKHPTYMNLARVFLNKGEYRMAARHVENAIKFITMTTPNLVCPEGARGLEFLATIHHTAYFHLDRRLGELMRSFDEMVEDLEEGDDDILKRKRNGRQVRHRQNGGDEEYEGSGADEDVVEYDEDHDVDYYDDDDEDEDVLSNYRSSQGSRGSPPQATENQLRILQQHLHEDSHNRVGATGAAPVSDHHGSSQEETKEDMPEETETKVSASGDEAEDYDEDGSQGTTTSNSSGSGTWGHTDESSYPSTTGSTYFKSTEDSLSKYPCPPDWSKISANLRFVYHPERADLSPLWRTIVRVKFLKEHNERQWIDRVGHAAMVNKRLSEREMILKKIEDLTKRYQAGLQMYNATDAASIAIPANLAPEDRERVVKLVLENADLAYQIATLHSQAGNVEKSLAMFRDALDARLRVMPPNASIMVDLDELAHQYSRHRLYSHAAFLFEKAAVCFREMGPSGQVNLAKALCNQASVHELKGDLAKAAQLYEESLAAFAPLADATAEALTVKRKLFQCYASAHNFPKCVECGRSILKMLPLESKEACDMRLMLCQVLLQGGKTDEAVAECEFVERVLSKRIERTNPEFFPVLTIGINLSIVRGDLAKAEESCRTLVNALRSTTLRASNTRELYSFLLETFSPVLIERARTALVDREISTEDRKQAMSRLDEVVTICKEVLSAVEDLVPERTQADERFLVLVFRTLATANYLKGKLKSAHDYYAEAFRIMSLLVGNDLRHPELVSLSLELDRVRDKIEELGNGGEEDLHGERAKEHFRQQQEKDNEVASREEFEDEVDDEEVYEDDDDDNVIENEDQVNAFLDADAKHPNGAPTADLIEATESTAIINMDTEGADSRRSPILSLEAFRAKAMATEDLGLAEEAKDQVGDIRQPLLDKRESAAGPSTRSVASDGGEGRIPKPGFFSLFGSRFKANMGSAASSSQRDSALSSVTSPRNLATVPSSQSARSRQQDAALPGTERVLQLHGFVKRDSAPRTMFRSCFACVPSRPQE